jgi:predicted aspartyl protease
MTVSVRLAFVAICASLGAPATPTHGIPFSFRTRQPIVQVSVNGSAAVPFVVDTGATIHLVDEEVARRAGVAGTSGLQMHGGGQAGVQAHIAESLTLQVGTLTWKQQRAALVPLGYPTRKHFAGLLGAQILKQYTVRFIFSTGILELFDPSTYKPPDDATVLPIELDEDLPIVHATLDVGTGPIDARLMVDTGAATFIDLNRPFVDAHKLLDAMPGAKAEDRPAALGGTAPFLYGTAREVVLGGVTFEYPRIGLSRATSGSSSRSERDGIIGNDLLSQYMFAVVDVDYRNRRLVLIKPGE